MTDEPTDDPRYRAARRIQRTAGRQLLERYGAHAISIEWASVGQGPPEPVLVFDVASERSGGPDEGLHADDEPVPPFLEDEGASGRPVTVRTQVRRSPPAGFE